MRRCAHVERPQLLTLQARNAAHFKVQPHAVRAIGAVYRKAFLGPIHDHMERQVFSRHWLYHFPLVWDALAPLAWKSDGTILIGHDHLLKLVSTTPFKNYCGLRDRIAMAALFEDAHKRKFDCVLFWALDRFTREGMQPTVMRLRADAPGRGGGIAKSW